MPGLVAMTVAGGAAHAASGGGGVSGYLVAFIVGAVLGIIGGREWGRRVSLRHLGEAEFQNRMRAVRGVRRM